MQKTELTYPSAKSNRQLSEIISLEALTSRLERTRLMQAAARLYTSILEEHVTPRHAVYYLYAQVMGALMLLPANIELGWRACAFTLFCMAASRTKRCEKDV